MRCEPSSRPCLKQGWRGIARETAAMASKFAAPLPGAPSTNQPVEPPVDSKSGVAGVRQQGQRAVESKKRETDLKVLKWHQDLAAQGGPFGQFEMGRRNLSGKGVEKDVAKARELFKAAATLRQLDRDQSAAPSSN